MTPRETWLNLRCSIDPEKRASSIGPIRLGHHLATGCGARHNGPLVLRRHVDDDVAERVLAPFSWTGAEMIASRLEALGYVDVDHRELVVNRVIGDPMSHMPTEVLGTTAGPSVEAKGPAVLDRIAAELIDAMAHHRVGDELHIPQHTHLVSARVG